MGRLGPFGLLLLALVGAPVLRGRLNRAYNLAPVVVDEARVPVPPVARALSLGHVEWAADVLWINAQIYYGESLFERLPGRFTRAYADTIIALDPQFREGYRWASLALTARTVARNGRDLLDAVAYLRRGHAALPADGEIEFELGYTLAFEYAQTVRETPAAYRAAKLEGGRHIGRAALGGWGPPWVCLSAATALRQGGAPGEALEYLRGVLPRVEDAAVRTRIEQRIASIQSEAPGADPLVQSASALERTRRAEYPYVEPGLYLFVGPRVVPASP